MSRLNCNWWHIGRWHRLVMKCLAVKWTRGRTSEDYRELKSPPLPHPLFNLLSTFLEVWGTLCFPSMRNAQSLRHYDEPSHPSPGVSKPFTSHRRSLPSKGPRQDHLWPSSLWISNRLHLCTHTSTQVQTRPDNSSPTTPNNQLYTQKLIQMCLSMDDTQKGSIH